MKTRRHLPDIATRGMRVDVVGRCGDAIFATSANDAMKSTPKSTACISPTLSYARAHLPQLGRNAALIYLSNGVDSRPILVLSSSSRLCFGAFKAFSRPRSASHSCFVEFGYTTVSCGVCFTVSSFLNFRLSCVTTQTELWLIMLQKTLSMVSELVFLPLHVRSNQPLRICCPRLSSLQ